VSRPLVVSAAALAGAALATLAGAGSSANTRVAACTTAGPYRAPAAARPRYSLHVRLQPALRRASGDLRVVFRPDIATGRLVFRLWPNGPLQRREGARLTVSNVTVRGTPLPTALANPTTLVVRPPRPLAAGSRIVVSLRWSLRVPRGVPDRLDGAPGSIRLGSFFPLLAWEPGRGWALEGPPLMPAESSTSPVADFDVHISAPAGLRVFASGNPVAPGHWRAHAVRDFAVAAGRFAVASETVRAPRPVRITVAVQAKGGGAVPDSSLPFAHAGTPREFLARAAVALRTLSRLYGPYPWPSFTAVVERDAFATGGIEYPTLVFLGYLSLLTAVEHEAAHQWFYSLVGNNQGRDPWLDETLASWAQTQVNPLARPYFLHVPVPRAARGMLGAPIAYWNRHRRAYSAGVYAQGVQALASLGSAAKVNCGLRRYVARYGYRIATQGELLDMLNQAVPGARRKLERYGAQP
jgi:hypothetical protein